MINRLLDGFEGKLTSSKYAKLTKCFQDTASRDIDDLMARVILLDGSGRRAKHELVAGTDRTLQLRQATQL